jgi:hypothetical protein
VQALTLASDACQADVASTILAHADEWRGALDAEVERGREEGRAAIRALEGACRQIAGAASARHWIDAGRSGHVLIQIALPGAASLSGSAFATSGAARNPDLFRFKSNPQEAAALEA